MVRRIDAMDFRTMVISDENLVGLDSDKLFA